ncbi:MAG: hypothetical protein ACOX2P_00035 [Bacillota bacterium]
MGFINDRIILGLVSGIIAAKPVELLNMVKQRSGLTDISYAQVASKIFIPEEKMDTPLGNAISALVNNVNASASGIALTYLLTLTGRDKSIIKGISFGSVLWIVVNGLISSIGLDLKSKQPLTHVLSWLDHAIFGALCACLIRRLGSDNLFPDRDFREQKKIPLFYFPKN